MINKKLVIKSIIFSITFLVTLGCASSSILAANLYSKEAQVIEMKKTLPPPPAPILQETLHSLPPPPAPKMANAKKLGPPPAAIEF